MGEERSEIPRARAVRAGSNVSVRPAPVQLELLTDPWSIWCWGFEPARRAIELRYPTIRFQPLVGGMFPQMPDPEAMGFDVNRFFAIVQRATGMPIRAVDPQDRPDSTYPACVHVHAVRILDESKEHRYLRALREAVYLDGKNVSDPRVAASVAEGVGVDAEAFRGVLESGAAEDAFKDRLADLHARSLHAYPTYLLQWSDRAARVEGFQAIPAILGLAATLSGTNHAPLPDPELPAIVPEGERVATREVAEVLGVSLERAVEILEKAMDDSVIVRERHRTGDVWVRTD